MNFADNDLGDEEIAFVTEPLDSSGDSNDTPPHRNTTSLELATSSSSSSSSPNAAAPTQPSANRQSPWSTYDPYRASARPPPGKPLTTSSLLDDDLSPPSAEQELVPPPLPTADLEEFLEMEDDEGSPSRSKLYTSQADQSPPRPSAKPTTTIAATSTPLRHAHTAEPIVTSSGLLLTHRRTTPAPRKTPLPPNHHIMSSLPRNLHRGGFLEVEAPHYYAGDKDPYGNQRLWSLWRRRLSLVWIWLALSAVIFLAGSAVLWHHVSAADNQPGTAKEDHAGAAPVQDQYVNRIVLLPMNMEQQEQLLWAQQQQANNGQQQTVLLYPQQPLPEDPNNVPPHRRLSEWQEAFDAWAHRHGKTYQTPEERDYRLKVWMDNHHRTRAKNEKHGPCPLMQRPVFGNGNHFQDLTQDEFRSQYLNAQRKPRKLDSPRNAGTLGPHVPTRRHADVHHRIVQYHEDNYHLNARPRAQKAYNCQWYEVSCNLRWFIETYFYGYFGIGRTMEPAYDKDSYPNAIDWRSLGAVTDVRAQDNCGACWAITAVETLESAMFLATGELLTLSETEVILCNEDCKMCSGGWPENAFDYIMEHGGIPLRQDLDYDGEYLLKITNVLAGESDELR